MRLGIASALIAAVACAQHAQPAPKKSALDKATLEAYVRHLVLYPPQVKVTASEPKPSDVPGFFEVTVKAEAGAASEERSFLVSKDGQKILQASVYDVNQNPFQRELSLLKTENEPSIGTPGAPVVIALFSDFQCSYCKQEAEALRKNLLKEFPTQVRVYFKHFPLTQIHPWSEIAAHTGYCVAEQKAAAFWEYHDWAFEKQGEITLENFAARFGEFANAKGLDAAKALECASGPAARRKVALSLAEGKELGVNSTPTMFVNGRKIGGYVPWENLKQIVQFEADYQASEQNAGESCCALPSPSLLTQPAAGSSSKPAK
ncbi:MAG: thioredoxin domain-containing protein [Bryobacteraceae bacterium]